MPRMEGAQRRIRTATFAAVPLGTDNRILADTAMDQTNPTVVTTFANQPSVPRNVTVKGNAAAVTGNVLIEGTNAEGAAITETIALNGTATVAGTKAFASVTRVTLPVWAAANTERVRIGTGTQLGLPTRLSRNTVLAAFLANAREGTAPTVAVSASALESNTVILNSALNGSDVLIDFYETD